MGDGRREVFPEFGEVSAGMETDHSAVGHAAHVIDRSDRGKTEPSVEVLSGELGRKRHLARAGIVGRVEEKSHHLATGALPPGLRNGGNPRHERLTTLDERERQTTGGDGPALLVSSPGRGKGSERDQAARIV